MDPLLDDFKVSALIGRARSTLQKDRVTGEGPPFVRVGRLVRYRQSDVESWLAGLELQHSTSQQSAADAIARSMHKKRDDDHGGLVTTGDAR